MRSFSVRTRSLVTVGGVSIELSVRRRSGVTARNRRRC